MTAKTRYCQITGQPLPERPAGTRGRPLEFIDEDARQLARHLARVEVLLMKVGPKCTPRALTSLRGRVFNAVNLLNDASVRRRSGGPVPLEEMSRDELRAEAAKREIPGRGSMLKAELLTAIGTVQADFAGPDGDDALQAHLSAEADRLDGPEDAPFEDYNPETTLCRLCGDLVLAGTVTDEGLCEDCEEELEPGSSSDSRHRDGLDEPPPRLDLDDPTRRRGGRPG